MACRPDLTPVELAHKQLDLDLLPFLWLLLYCSLRVPQLHIFPWIPKMQPLAFMAWLNTVTFMSDLALVRNEFKALM